MYCTNCDPCLTRNNVSTFYDSGWPEDDHDCLKRVAFLIRLVLTVNSCFFIVVCSNGTHHT
jgi:hypothetical protein